MKQSIYGLVWSILVLLVGVSLALAQGYGLSGNTVDGGGGAAQTSDGQFVLNGSIAQPDAGVFSDSSGTYTLAGGYWEGTTVSNSPGSNTDVYLPILLRN